VRFSVANKPKALTAASRNCDIFDVGGAPTGHKNATTTALYAHNSGRKTGRKWQIGFEASCEVVSVARSSRSALTPPVEHDWDAGVEEPANPLMGSVALPPGRPLMGKIAPADKER
jgi:hypothetical protein